MNLGSHCYLLLKLFWFQHHWKCKVNFKPSKIWLLGPLSLGLLEPRDLSCHQIQPLSWHRNQSPPLLLKYWFQHTAIQYYTWLKRMENYQEMTPGAWQLFWSLRTHFPRNWTCPGRSGSQEEPESNDPCLTLITEVRWKGL